MAQLAVEENVTEQVVEALRAGLGERLRAVVLFGSRARGDARPESDWDFLVIAEGLPERVFDRRLTIHRLLPLVDGGGISVLAKTPEEFESCLPSLYLDIALDGRILHDPQGYAAERLGAIQQIIEEAGLYRVRSPAGDIWRWKEELTQPWVLEWKK